MKKNQTNFVKQSGVVLVDTLLFCRWVIPIVPEDVVWENQAIAILDGKILEILAKDQASLRYKAKEEVCLDSHVVMPGLVNAHAHSPMVLLRGFGDDLTLMDWLQKVIWPAERRFLSEDFVGDGAEIAIGEMIRSGTTCFNEHYFYPEVIANVAEKAGVRARIGIMMIEADNPWANDLSEAINKGVACWENYRHSDLVSVGLAPHSSYMLSDDALSKIKRFISEYEMPLHVHMHETQAEIDQEYKKYQKRPLKRFYDHGLLSKVTQLVHMTKVDEEDIDLIKKTGSSVVHCPSSNLKLASGLPPIQRFLDEGVNVALGTDGAASNNTLDLFQAIYLSALTGKIVADNSTAVSAMSVLKMATINGAKSLGLSDKVGSVEEGKFADLIAINMDCLNASPLFHPVSQLVYAMNSRQVSDVWVQGRSLLRSSKLVALDEEDLLHKAKLWQEKIKSA